jgi:hypothetical protein
MPVMTEPADKERRAWVRHPSRPETPFSEVAEEDYVIPQKARILDLSAAGVGLLVTGQIAPGTIVDVVLCRTSDDSSRTFPARVVHCRAQEGGGWLLGCNFTTPLREEQLQEFI